MIKTYIRMNNFYIMKDKNKYYKSTCSDPDEWSSLKNSDLSDYKGRKVTKKLKMLQKKYGKETMINYIIPKKSKKSKKTKKQKGG